MKRFSDCGFIFQEIVVETKENKVRLLFLFILGNMAILY